MKTIRNTVVAFLGMVIFSGCLGDTIKEKMTQGLNQANLQFEDQYFKTAIALIELHKVRYGDYPESLDDIKYVGVFDSAFYSSVTYAKLDTGYSLDAKSIGFGKFEKINYPDDFYKGIGLRKSNMLNDSIK